MQSLIGKLHGDRTAELPKSLSQQGRAKALAPSRSGLRAAALHPIKFHAFIALPPSQRDGAVRPGKRAVFGCVRGELVKNQRQYRRDLGRAFEILTVELK